MDISPKKINQSILIVGYRGGTNIGESFIRAATNYGLKVFFFESKKAYSNYSIINKVNSLFSNKPIYYDNFNKYLQIFIGQVEPTFILTTGSVPVSSDTIALSKTNGSITINYSTDDPWNSNFNFPWFFDSLSKYDFIFTPRKNNLMDFLDNLNSNTYYLQFGYDQWLFNNDKSILSPKKIDVFFAGGADISRANTIKYLINSGINIKTAGDYWSRYGISDNHNLGQLSPASLIENTISSKINICFVRKANRDGHVMRTFELARLGSCMIVEETQEHKEIFGKEGESVLYFTNNVDLLNKINFLLSNVVLQNKLSLNVTKLVGLNNSYTDRLRKILDICDNQ